MLGLRIYCHVTHRRSCWRRKGRNVVRSHHSEKQWGVSFDAITETAAYVRTVWLGLVVWGHQHWARHVLTAHLPLSRVGMGRHRPIQIRIFCGNQLYAIRVCSLLMWTDTSVKWHLFQLIICCLWLSIAIISSFVNVYEKYLRFFTRHYPSLIYSFNDYIIIIYY